MGIGASQLCRLRIHHLYENVPVRISLFPELGMLGTHVFGKGIGHLVG